MQSHSDAQKARRIPYKSTLFHAEPFAKYPRLGSFIWHFVDFVDALSCVNFGACAVAEYLAKRDIDFTIHIGAVLQRKAARNAGGDKARPIYPTDQCDAETLPLAAAQAALCNSSAARGDETKWSGEFAAPSLSCAAIAHIRNDTSFLRKPRVHCRDKTYSWYSGLLRRRWLSSR